MSGTVWNSTQGKDGKNLFVRPDVNTLANPAIIIPTGVDCPLETNNQIDILFKCKKALIPLGLWAEACATCTFLHNQCKAVKETKRPSYLRKLLNRILYNYYK